MPLKTSFHRKQSSGRWPSRNFKRREVLSVNMISLPLADFRHISHISNDAHRDSFGDLSFLRMDNNLLLQSSKSEQNLFMACSPPPKPPRLNMVEIEGLKSPDWSVSQQQIISQKRKKCNSLPLLEIEEGQEKVEKEDEYQTGNNAASNEPLSHDQGNMSSKGDGVTAESFDKTAGQTKEEDNGFAFSLDLGPSILDDVLQVMEKLYT